MYQSFTGRSRKARQVNLSGRTSTNPFASVGTKGPSNAVTSAQEERAERARQRQRLQAAGRIQKLYRGHLSRKRTYRIWRERWDADGQRAMGAFETEDDALCQLRRLLLFYSPRGNDPSRLVWYGQRLLATCDKLPCTQDPWPAAYLNLLKATLAALASRTAGIIHDQGRSLQDLLLICSFTARRARMDKEDAIRYYGTLIGLAEVHSDALQAALLAPLNHNTEAYAGLAVLLAEPLSTTMLDMLRSTVDRQSLISALYNTPSAPTSPRQRLWLLGNVIDITMSTSEQGRSSRPDITSIAVVSTLLGSLSDAVDFEGTTLESDNETFDRDVLTHVPASLKLPLNRYLQMQVNQVVDQHLIRNLLAASAAGERAAQILASFALTLLRCFPKRADEIRMWLYLGPPGLEVTQPATVYFWEALKHTSVFETIINDSRAVIGLLKSNGSDKKEEWTVILLFFELYTFLLKLMDDEEFMGIDRGGKRSQIPLDDVADLVTFLKNLGFTLYFNAAELNDASAQNGDARLGSNAPTGLSGVTLDYLKGLITGLLRAVYERDSRRSFLSKDHWLMTSRFDMSGFIDGVVAEEEKRHAVQSQEDQEDKEDGFDDEDEITTLAGGRLSLGGRAAQLRSQVLRERDQKKASRRRYLESVAPRLEILQNLPFFIPFETRVEIFRQFVALDQEKRRNGVTDPDEWRAQMMAMAAGNGLHPFARGGPLARHTATVRRKQEFEDAYDAFYNLGEALKEPIQITFEDQWGNAEAGIDGGGVTKEFLTSVINQAFDHEEKSLEGHFFIENESHLLYPNPTAVEDLKAYLGDVVGLAENEQATREAVREMLRKFEFLGRIIGKCLYEGILVDVSFAGFFFKKWALTGGSGSAPMESGYRANINDLKELDDGLYKNLLWLKNASPNEVDDLGVTFTVDDSVGPKNGPKRVIEHELIPGGADKTVNAENRLIYINRMAWYRLQGQSSHQTNAFLKGVGSMIQPSWLSMFNQTELQTLISGSKAGIDIDDLRANTLYGGVYVIGDDGLEHETVQNFWRVMSTLDDADRQRVLKFVTSTPRGPLLGFGHLNPRFSIRDSGQDENRLPSTSTCVNLLKLPMYKSEKVLREKLLHAVRSGAGFDLS